MADALSHIRSLVCVLSHKITTLYHIKDEYETCPNFGAHYVQLLDNPYHDPPYHLQEGYLLYGNHYIFPDHPLEITSCANCTLVVLRRTMGIITRLIWPRNTSFGPL